MKKKLFLALITVILVIFAVGITTSAASLSDLTYEISNGEVTIIDCKESASGELTIPDKINGYPVTSIGGYAFYWCSRLSSITIPDSVTYIGNGAFYCCLRLSIITIPDGVTSIREHTFYWCLSLSSITLPNSITSIDKCAFNKSSIKHINIPDSVTYIGEQAFSECDDLENINIPHSVTYIGEQAFSKCDSLSNILVDTDNKYYSSLNGNLYDKYKTTLIQYAIGKSDYSFTIPANITTIFNYAFANCIILSKIDIPDSVTYIGNGAFYSCLNLAGVYYTGTEENWNTIYIDSANTSLTNASIHYVYAVTLSDTDGQKQQVFLDRSNVTPANTGNIVILAIYNGDRIVEVMTAPFDSKGMSFSANKSYTTAKVMVWDGLSGAKPLCQYEIIE